MGVEAAIRLGTPRPDKRGDANDRSTRLAAVSAILRMQRDLQRALDQTTDADLARMVVAARQGELAMGAWAAQLAAYRDIKRRFDAAGAAVVWRRQTVVTRRAQGLVANARGIPFLWEALAFALGCMTSFLVI